LIDPPLHPDMPKWRIGFASPAVGDLK